MKIQLFHGDCLEVMKSLPDGCIDAIIADLPFGITKAKWDREINLEELWREYLRLLKTNGVVILNASQPFTSKIIQSQSKLFRFTYYWQKNHPTNFLRSAYQPLRVIEEICVFSRNGRYTYNPKMVEMKKPVLRGLPTIGTDILGNEGVGWPVKGEMRDYTHSHPKNLIEVPRDHSTAMLIPTQKPVALMEYLISTFTNAGDMVMDNTMGSGTTGVACVNLRRHFIGIEKARAHFEIAKRRIYGAQNVGGEVNAKALGARKTHFLRTSRQEKAIQDAIKKAKKAKLKITKTLIAQMVGLSRQQITQRYAHLFSKSASAETDAKVASPDKRTASQQRQFAKIAAE